MKISVSKNIPWNKGLKIDKDKYPNMGFHKKHSEESKHKMSLARIGKIPSNIDQLIAMPPWNKGLKGVQVSWCKGTKGIVKAWNKGLKIDRKIYPNMGHHKKHSEESKKKMSEARKGKSAFWNVGEKSPMWKGGVTPLNKKTRRSIEFRLWREAVFARDNWTCQKYGIRGGKLHPHHIQNFAEYPELRFAINNGITLSEKAHKEFHKRYGLKNNTKEQIIKFINNE